MRPRGRDSAELRFWGKLFAAFFVVLMVTVWEHVSAIGVTRGLKNLHKEVDRLTYENGRMQMQIHQWESPSHLDVVARKDLNMVPLDAAHVIGLEQP